MIALVIWHDRHTDIEVEPYWTAADAIARAEDIVGDYDRPGDGEPGFDELGDDELFYARLSGEGDYVEVVQREVRGLDR